MIRGIIFDCFGVLYIGRDKTYLEQFPRHQQQIATMNHAANQGLISRDTYIAGVSELIGRSYTEVDASLLAEHTANRQLLDIIRDLRRHGYKTAILSNIGRGWMRDFFDRHALHDLFDAVVVSGEEKMAKPEPLIFQRTAERLGLDASECLMIDDIPANCAAAKAVGMAGIVYHTVEQLQADMTALLGEKPHA